ncbi:MAG: hypothetical protein ACRDFB_09370 [Rhabdochlamydiaceae bacterium]
MASLIVLLQIRIAIHAVQMTAACVAILLVMPAPYLCQVLDR